MATDIGICLGRILKGKQNEVWKLQVQIPLLTAFFLGGVCGSIAHKHHSKHAMFIPAFIFGGIGIMYVLVIAYVRKESLWDALIGDDENNNRADGGAVGTVGTVGIGDDGERSCEMRVSVGHKSELDNMV